MHPFEAQSYVQEALELLQESFNIFGNGAEGDATETTERDTKSRGLTAAYRVDGRDLGEVPI